MATPGRVPRTAGWRRISLLRRPFTKKALHRFTFSFVKKEIEFTREGVGIHLLVPPPLLPHTKPLDDAPVLFRGQAIDSGFDLLNSAQAWSLSPPRSGFHPMLATHSAPTASAGRSEPHSAQEIAPGAVLFPGTLRQPRLVNRRQNPIVCSTLLLLLPLLLGRCLGALRGKLLRSEEHTSELQS